MLCPCPVQILLPKHNLKIYTMRNSWFLFVICSWCIAKVVGQVPSFIPTNGLVGWWPFNGNSNDESGSGNNGTGYGATLTTDRFGNANSANSFNGVANYILVPDSNINTTIYIYSSLCIRTKQYHSLRLIS